jgi:hypothetical protein
VAGMLVTVALAVGVIGVWLGDLVSVATGRGVIVAMGEIPWSDASLVAVIASGVLTCKQPVSNAIMMIKIGVCLGTLAVYHKNLWQALY